MNCKCENCGRQPLVNTDIAILPLDEGGARILCKTCASKFGTCEMCAHLVNCGFFHDPDPSPQFTVVARQMRQGNATFVEQKQIPNPERVKKFCVEGKCKCLLDDSEHPLCCRYGGYTTCTNYCEKTQFNFVQDFPMEDTNEN